MAGGKNFLPHLRAALIGFHIYRNSTGGIQETLVAIPAWPAILITAIPPALWWLRRRRRRARGFPMEVAQGA